MAKIKILQNLTSTYNYLQNHEEDKQFTKMWTI